MIKYKAVCINENGYNANGNGINIEDGTEYVIHEADTGSLFIKNDIGELVRVRKNDFKIINKINEQINIEIGDIVSYKTIPGRDLEWFGEVIEIHRVEKTNADNRCNKLIYVCNGIPQDPGTSAAEIFETQICRVFKNVKYKGIKGMNPEITKEIVKHYEMILIDNIKNAINNGIDYLEEEIIFRTMPSESRASSTTRYVPITEEEYNHIKLNPSGRGRVIKVSDFKQLIEKYYDGKRRIYE